MLEKSGDCLHSLDLNLGQNAWIEVLIVLLRQELCQDTVQPQ